MFSRRSHAQTDLRIQLAIPKISQSDDNTFILRFNKIEKANWEWEADEDSEKDHLHTYVYKGPRKAHTAQKSFLNNFIK